MIGNDNDCLVPAGDPIINFAEMTEKQIFEAVKKAHQYYSAFNEGENYRLKYLKLDYGQQFNSI